MYFPHCSDNQKINIEVWCFFRAVCQGPCRHCYISVFKCVMVTKFFSVLTVIVAYQKPWVSLVVSRYAEETSHFVLYSVGVTSIYHCLVV